VGGKKMNWLGRLLHKSPAESELDKELRFHLEQQIAAGVAKGLSLKRRGDVPNENSVASNALKKRSAMP
jgi:hypothetical protein